MIKKKSLTKLFLYVFLITIAFIEILPLIVALINSLRTDSDIKRSAIGFFKYPQFSNYAKAWVIGGYKRAFINSAIISISSSILTVIVSLIGGYFLARVNSRFSAFVKGYFAVTLSIPIFAFIIPVYYAFSELNLINTYSGVIILFLATNMGFNLILASTFIKGIPTALDEAARIDGCSTYMIIWKIILPLAKPIITTILLIVFVSTWNEFALSNTFIQINEMKTAATRYVLFCTERGSNLALIYAAGMITSLPIVVIFLFLQNNFIDGITAGSVKE
jgi:raffinose/stachyose/melibiose transport system permease protein